MTHISLRSERSATVSLKADAVEVGDGTKDYEMLNNKPRIEGSELVGDKALRELGITVEGMGLSGLVEDVEPVSNLEIDSLFR